MDADRSTPLWLWPNLLSLDAPLVAAVWQMLFARAFGASLNSAEVGLLGITVWLIYAADRALDAKRGVGTSARHAFYRVRGRKLLPLWLAALSLAAWISVTQLSGALFLRGAVLLAMVMVYLGVVHLAPARLQRWWPKEAVVGVLFALGASLVAWSKVRTPVDAAVIVLFCGLCWMNCVAIERWEHHFDWSAVLPAAGIAIVAVVLFDGRPRLGGAVMISALSFVALDILRKKFSDNAVRVLADVALLAPVLFLRGFPR